MKNFFKNIVLLILQVDLNDSRLTDFLKTCVKSALTINIGDKTNRYSDKIRDLAGYFLARRGKKDYDFDRMNLKFPESSTVRKYMQKQVKPLEEGKAYFDELAVYLHKNNFKKEVSLIEDGTKITECVEYIRNKNILCGLVPKINEFSGMPDVNSYAADTAKNIYTAVENNDRSSYVQLLLAQPNNSGNAFLICSLDSKKLLFVAFY